MRSRLNQLKTDTLWRIGLRRTRWREGVRDLRRAARGYELQRYCRPTILAAAILAATTGTVTLAVFVGITAYPYLADSRLPELKLLDACSRAIAVYDAGGWIGNIPTSMMSGFSDTSERCRQSVLDGWHAHQSGYVVHPPAAWWKMLVAIEDRRHGSFSSINCVDLPALGVVAGNVLLGRWHRGGSSIAMQLSRSLRGRAPSADETIPDKARRKLTEIADATVLCRALGGAHGRELKRWVARHLPCMHGTAGSRLGGTIYGLEGCSWIAFGKAVGELDLAEQAVLVAAVRRHILVSADDPADRRRAADRWEQILERAVFAIDSVFGPDDPEAHSAKLKLVELKPWVPAMRPALQDLLPADSTESIAVAGNPARRVAYFAHGEVNQALGEILDLYGGIPDELVGMELTVDVADNAAVKRDIEAVLDGRAAARPLRLDLPPPSGTADRMADVSMSLVADGRVLRLYSSGHDRVWSGANAKRDESGRYQPQREDRAIGSVAKIMAAVLLGTRFTTTDGFCNRWLGGLRNAGGNRGFRSCAVSAAWVGARIAFARSLNLPVAWALRAVPEMDIRTLVADAGLQLSDPTVAPHVSLAFGMVTGGVRQQSRLVAALHRGSRGRVPEAVLPTLIRSLHFRKEDGSIRSVDFDAVRDHARIDLSAWFENPHAGAFVAEMLMAPAAAGGTLAGLDRIVRSAGGSKLIAKSGTTTTPHGHIRDQLAVGGFLGDDGKEMTFHLLIGSSHPERPLADRVGVSRVDQLRLIETLLVKR